MFVATFLTFMTIGGFPSFVEDIKVCCVLFIVELLINFKHIDFIQKFMGNFTSSRTVKSFVIIFSNY
jgi:hypothetical protein